ncbi:MAG: ATP-grasp domain-containing protein [Pseudomonadota bacterium]
MPVFILDQDGSPGDLNRLTAQLGFAQLGEEVIGYTDASFDTLPLKAGDIVVGGVGYVRRAQARLGLHMPDIPAIPGPLRSFAGRDLWQAPLAEVRERVNAGEAIFVKPAPDQTKRFTGAVWSAFRDLIETAHLPGDTLVDCAGIVDFRAEYRTFVQHGDILDMRPYKGDPLCLPNPDVVRDAVAAYADGPAAYALDVGVTAEGATLVVEVNDAYATGAYGLAPVRYAGWITARWTELWSAHNSTL